MSIASRDDSPQDSQMSRWTFQACHLWSNCLHCWLPWASDADGYCSGLVPQVICHFKLNLHKSTYRHYQMYVKARWAWRRFTPLRTNAHRAFGSYVWFQQTMDSVRNWRWYHSTFIKLCVCPCEYISDDSSHSYSHLTFHVGTSTRWSYWIYYINLLRAHLRIT